MNRINDTSEREEINKIIGRGFVVKTTDDSSVMDVRLSNKGSSGWFGKIIHPSQATIYKVGFVLLNFFLDSYYFCSKKVHIYTCLQSGR